LLAGTFNFVHAQGFLKNIKNAANNIVAGKPAISTNFKDVDVKNILPADFGSDKTYTTLKSLKKTDEGCYDLGPGFYQTTNLSYCLKAGTHGPAKGDAYGLAPVDGKMADIVETILVKSQELWKGRRDTSRGLMKTVAANGITQKDVQLLLWAIIAKADFETMQNKTKATALAFLSADQMFKLYGGAEKIIKKVASDQSSGAIRTLQEIEGEIRRMFQSATSSYEDIERLAVLAGMAQEANPVEAGTWFLHPDGYYLRFEPHGYSRTTVKVYVPEGKKVCPVITGYVATPSDSRQRLAQTDMSEEEYSRIALK
jgi:hypothetical protein